MNKLNIAIIGQGRSGKDIHGRYLLSELNDCFRVKYIVERDERRRAISKERYPGCTVFEDYRELFEIKDISLVVNASFSNEHYPVSLDLLSHGFSVLSEKPMARNRFECENLIRTAKENGVLFTVFQNTMFAPFYIRAINEAMSGKFGKILEVKIRYSSLSRRWDWQTLQKKLGGNAYNTGPHPIGIGMGFLGFSKDTKVLYSKLDRTEMTSGDADDFCKILMTAPGKPLVDIEIHSTDAFSDYNIRFIGTRGTYQSTLNSFKSKYIVPEENIVRPVEEHFIQDSDGNPIYCSEHAAVHEEEGQIKGNAFTEGADALYREIYARLTENKPFTYSPEDYVQIYRVLEAVHAGSALERKY